MLDADGNPPLAGQLTIDAPAKRSRKRPPAPLTVDEVARLMAAPSRRSSAGIRDRALLALALRGGLRLGELHSLLLKQFVDAAPDGGWELANKIRRTDWPAIQQMADNGPTEVIWSAHPPERS